MGLIPQGSFLPLKVVEIEHHLGADRNLIYNYIFRVDEIQSQLLAQKWHEDNEIDLHDCRNHADIHPAWIMAANIQLATKGELPIGVGDMFTIDLVPYDKLPEPDMELMTLQEWIRRLTGER